MQAQAAKVGLTTRETGTANNSKKQIPHRLKSVRDDKNKGLITAHLKVRPFKSIPIRVFSKLYSRLGMARASLTRRGFARLHLKVRPFKTAFRTTLRRPWGNSCGSRARFHRR